MKHREKNRYQAGNFLADNVILTVLMMVLVGACQFDFEGDQEREEDSEREQQGRDASTGTQSGG